VLIFEIQRSANTHLSSIWVKLWPLDPHKIGVLLYRCLRFLKNWSSLMYEDGLTRVNGGKAVGHDHKNGAPNNTEFKPMDFSKLIQTKPDPVISADWCLSSLEKFLYKSFLQTGIRTPVL